MRIDNLTDLGKKLLKDAKEIGLSDYYDPMTGDFEFTSQAYKENEDKIKKFLDTHDDYAVIRYDASIFDGSDLSDSEDGYAYFLTNWGYDENSDFDIIIGPKNKTKESLEEDSEDDEFKEIDDGPEHGYDSVSDYNKAQEILAEMSRLRDEEADEESKLIKAWAVEKTMSDEDFTNKSHELHTRIQNRENELYHELISITTKDESLKESKEEDKLETFEDKMNFLAKDEQEAIDGYDKVLGLLDAEKDAVVIEQLTKIKVEEEAHKKYLEDVQSNHDLVYTEPLEQEEDKKEEGEDGRISKKMLNDMNLDVDAIEQEIEQEIKEGAEGHKVPGKEYVIYDCSLEKEKKAPIVAIRSTYTEAQWYCNKPGNFDKDLGIEEVPVGKFKKGDDFYGPFDGDWNLIDESFFKEPDNVKIGNTITYWTKFGKTKKAKVIDITDEGIFLDNEDVIRFGSSKKPHDSTDLQGDYIVDIKEDIKKTELELPVETYTKPEDIKRINDELDKKAKEGKLIGIRKEPKMLMLSEPAINGIWVYYLDDKGFIKKIVLF